jgi:hypothetical protein
MLGSAMGPEEGGEKREVELHPSLPGYLLEKLADASSTLALNHAPHKLMRETAQSIKKSHLTPQTLISLHPK